MQPFPAKGVFMDIYVVKPGDSVDLIASYYGIPPSTIIYDNQLVYPYPLAIGQALLVNDGESSSPSYPAVVGGYAYPYIREAVLEETLPYLTNLHVFSYGFTPEGQLVPPQVDDTFMITAALNFGASPVLTLTPFGPDGHFNNLLITTLVNNEEIIQTLLSNLLSTLLEKGFQGVDIDFEYILPEDRIPFADFVAQTREFLSPYGFHVSVALAPKTSDSQQGVLYEGKDYALLGSAADSVLLMTYEWGYTYGPPMAVAPLDKVRQVVEYAVTEIDPEKIYMGIPNYGYDWKLPFVNGTSKAETIGNEQAVERAILFGSEILYDERAVSPYYNYFDENGIEHVVWFENVVSIQGKLDLIREFQLKGAGYWNLMRPFTQNWRLLQSSFRIASS